MIRSAMFLKCRAVLFSSLDLPDMTVVCEEWVENVVNSVAHNLNTTLHYVQSVSSVAGLVKPYWQVGLNFVNL